MKDYRILMLVIGFFSLAMISCQSSLLPSEYVAWVTNLENGLLQEKQVGDWNAKVQYKPIPFIIANQERTNDLEEQQLKRGEQAYEGLQYYNLVLDIATEDNILSYKVSNNIEHQQRIQYFSFAMQQDIYLEEAGKQLPCKVFHFERNYNLTKERTFTVAFEQQADTKWTDKTFVLDATRFGIGLMKLTFKEEDLKNIPTITTID